MDETLDTRNKWNLVKESLPVRDPWCMANASEAVEVLYVGPFHSDGTYDIYRGSMSRYFFDTKEWECTVHNNLRQTFEDIGYKVVAWHYYDSIPAEIDMAIRNDPEIKLAQGDSPSD
jgi:hypothetical protein